MKDNKFNFEQLYVYWTLKDAVHRHSWVDSFLHNGSLMKIELFCQGKGIPITVAYNRYFDGRYELKYVETTANSTVQETDGYISNVDTFYDKEAWEMINAV